jgi:hypothetical protein
MRMSDIVRRLQTLYNSRVFMRKIMGLLLVFSNLNSFSQTTNVVAFITRFDITKATIDGYIMNGYIVAISYEKAQKLNGKKIKVTGKVTIVNGLKNRPKQYDRNRKEVMTQGRVNDTKHIDSPSIKVLEK